MPTKPKALGMSATDTKCLKRLSTTLDAASYARFRFIRERQDSDEFLNAAIKYLCTVAGWITADCGRDSAVNALKLVQQVVRKLPQRPKSSAPPPATTERRPHAPRIARCASMQPIGRVGKIVPVFFPTIIPCSFRRL